MPIVPRYAAARTTLSFGPGETPLLQTLSADPQPAAVPKQNLHPVAVLVGKHEPVAGQRVLLEYRLCKRKQPIEARPQIHRLGGDKDPRS